MRSLRYPYLLKITTDTQHIVETAGRFGDVVRDQLQVEAASVTDDEAQHLLNYRDADTHRAGIASAGNERADRLRARGVPQEDGGSEGEERGIGEGGELSGHNGIARVEVSPRHKLVYGDDSRLCVWAAERLGTPDMQWPSDTKTTPVIGATGVTMGAVKELDAKVERIARSIGSMPKRAQGERRAGRAQHWVDA